MSSRHSRPKLSELWIIMVMLVPIVLLWHTEWLLPLKLIVVMFHELSHALMTLITGGKIVAFNLSFDQSGHVISQGGIRFLILNAGYLGSLMFAMALLISARNTSSGRASSIALAISLLVLMLLYVRSVSGLLICIASIIIFAFLAYKANARVLRYSLMMIGLTSLLYAPLDIYHDTIRGSGQASDAAMLAAEYGGVAWLWGAFWLIISVLMIVYWVKKSYSSTV